MMPHNNSPLPEVLDNDAKRMMKQIKLHNVSSLMKHEVAL